MCCDGDHNFFMGSCCGMGRRTSQVLSKCANPECSAHMKYMHAGRLYVIPTASIETYTSHDRGEFSAPRGKQIECFWLCDVCCRQMTITREGELVCNSAFSHSWKLKTDAALVNQESGEVRLPFSQSRIDLRTVPAASPSIN